MYYKLSIKEKRLRKKIIQSHIKFYGILLFIVYLAFLSPVDVFGQNNVATYKVFNEMKISTKEMSCEYHLGYSYKAYYNFEYPKIIITEENNPIIAIFDENSKEIIFTEILGQHTKIISRIDSFSEQTHPTDRWPIIIYHQNEINLAILKEDHPKKKESKYYLQIYKLDLDKSRVELKSDIHVLKDDSTKELFRYRSSLSGIYPMGETKYIIVGRFEDVHFHPGGLISGDFPTFAKNFSLIWDGDKIGQYQRIEKNGWFGALNSVYAISQETMHSAWVRNTSRIGLSSKHTETVCYSRKKSNSVWSEPLELYETKTNGYKQIQDISASCNESKAYLLWEDKDKGVYFAEIGSDEKERVNIKHLSSRNNGDFPHREASRMKVVSDTKGNVFAVWIENLWTRTSRNYRINFRARVGDKWLPLTIVSKGTGLAQQPDIAIDKKENIHITYIKENPKDSFGCYYLRLSPLSVERE